MAASGISSVKSQKKKFRSISTCLASAFLEWLLICMLFVDAIFAYLITKFAYHWELQTPCLLCSRLDHILGSKKKYYWDLICANHKLEVSSLVFCRAHNNLVDVHGMCESCLFSFATVDKSNAETYRLLVGKLGEDSSSGLDQYPLLDGQISSTRHCTCCNEPWIPRGYGQKLIQATSAADLEVPLSISRKHDCNNLKQSKRSAPIRTTHQKTSGFDNLSHVGYTELKIESDSESEVLLSDDNDDGDYDDANGIIHQDVPIGDGHPEPCIITLPDDSVSEKLIDPVSAPQPSILVSQVQSDVIESNSIPIGHGLEELNWQQADISALPELISLDEVPPSSITGATPIESSKGSGLISLDDVPQSLDARETPIEASKESKIISADEIPPLLGIKETLVENSKESKSKLISLADVLPPSNGAETPVQGLKEGCVSRNEEIWQTSRVDCEEICKPESQTMTAAETASEINPVSGENSQQVANSLDLSGAYKLAVGNRGRQLSDVLAEQWTAKDSSRLSEDLKLLFSQLSAAREQSMTELSPRAPISPRVPISPKLSFSDDLKASASDASSAIGMQLLQKRISLERNESGLSLDGSIVSEIEGESVVDRLKRQVEHDKKLLSALYKELEEERNASTIAANQAMAMITRIQEEKATLHMEALQCLRMMEEQAEYDMEALQKTNDLLTEKEKEVQDLEAELEFYRNKFPDESMLYDTVEPISDKKATDASADHPEAGCMVDSFCRNRNPVTEEPYACHKVEETNMPLGNKNIATVNGSLLEFEDERSYILQSLKKLRSKLCLFSNNVFNLDLANGEHSGNEGKGNILGEVNSKLGIQQDSLVEENESSTDDRGTEHARKSTVDKSEFSGKENTEIFYSGPSSPLPPGEINLDSLLNEASDLSERLEALEADQNFLEHSINSLRYGKEGLQFIQEIASDLKDLRKIGIGRKEQ